MGAECVGEFTVYKRAGSPHYTVIRLKTSFCSATYRPKAHRPIYRDLGALVHSKYLYLSVRHIALIVGTWSRSYPQGPRENNKAAPDSSSGDGMIVRSDAPILRKQQTEARNPVLSLRNRKFESISLQHGVRCEPDFRLPSRQGPTCSFEFQPGGTSRTHDADQVPAPECVQDAAETAQHLRLFAGQ